MWINKKYDAIKDEYIKSLEKQIDAYKELCETTRKYADDLKVENVLLELENKKIMQDHKRYGADNCPYLKECKPAEDDCK